MYTLGLITNSPTQKHQKNTMSLKRPKKQYPHHHRARLCQMINQMNSKDVIAFHSRILNIPGSRGSISHALPNNANTHNSLRKNRKKEQKNSILWKKKRKARHPGYKHKKWSILPKERCEFNQIIMISCGLIGQISDFIE